MKKTQLKRAVQLLPAVIILFFMSACGGHSDKDIQENVDKQLQQNADLKGISATVKDGVVTLTGNCTSDNCDSLATQQVKGVDGVKSVDNQIQKQVTTDVTLRTSVQSIVSKYDGVQADVAGGVVVLRGSIEKSQLDPMMNELQALKPKKLDNQLAIK